MKVTAPAVQKTQLPGSGRSARIRARDRTSPRIVRGHGREHGIRALELHQAEVCRSARRKQARHARSTRSSSPASPLARREPDQARRETSERRLAASTRPPRRASLSERRCAAQRGAELPRVISDSATHRAPSPGRRAARRAPLDPAPERRARFPRARRPRGLRAPRTRSTARAARPGARLPRPAELDAGPDNQEWRLCPLS